MAKLKMQRVSIAVTNKDKKRLVSKMQKYGAVEIKRSQSTEGFEKQDYTSEQLVFERMVSAAKQALKILDDNAPKESGMLDFLNGRRVLSLNEYYENAKDAKDAIEICYDINALDKQLGECKAEIARLKIAIDMLGSWSSLDVPTGMIGTSRTKTFIGSFNREMTVGEVTQLIGETGYDKDYSLEVVSSGYMQTNVFALCLKKDADEFDGALRKAGFSYLTDTNSKLMPTEMIKYMTERRDALIADCDTIVTLIKNMAESREKIEFFIDFYSMRVERYKLYSELLSSKHVTLIEGYITAEKAADFTEKIESEFNAAVEVSDPDPNDEDVPVALKNNKFNRPCESIVTMFSSPGKDDVDPTSAMAFFFYLFFGMMLSDAGYGLLIVIATAVVLKKFNLEQSMRNTMQMFLYSGISTMFWGFMFGGFFGDLIPKAAEVYFGVNFTMPALLNPIDDALVLLVIGLGLGVVHIMVGMGISFYNLCRQGHVADAIFDVGTWMVTIVGMVAAIAGMFAKIDLLGNIGIGILAVGIVALLLTQGRKSKGFGKVIKGITSIYDITGYASDILSYCRLMALGLATGVFAQVINQLGMNQGVFGFIMFLIIFIVGNLISFGMNALGAYVHTIRLQYVEFFSKFYEGGGKPFEPFAAKTEYVRINGEQDK